MWVDPVCWWLLFYFARFVFVCLKGSGTIIFWRYVQHMRVTRESEPTQTRNRNRKILEKGETIRFGETFPREQRPVCVQCWRKWWIQRHQRSISINSTFERVNVMHIYINGDNWLLWILSTIRSKTKIISSRRVAYCNTAALHFPRNETLQHIMRPALTTGAAHNIPPPFSSWPLWVKIPETKWEQEPVLRV